MRIFFEGSKIFVAIVVGALIIGGTIYFSRHQIKNNGGSSLPLSLSLSQCLAPSISFGTKTY